MNGRKMIGRGLLAGAALSAGSLVERAVDPFDRHEVDYGYTLITPNEDPNAPGISAYKRDELGSYESDSTGDVLVIMTLASLAGGLALRGGRDPEHEDQDQPLEPIS